MPDDPRGGRGYSWFLVDVTSDYVEPPPPPDVVPGDGGVGHSWFAIEVTSEYVEPPPEPEIPPDQGTTDTGFFAQPVLVGEPFERRFKAKVDGPTLEPITAVFSGMCTGVKAFESIVPGTTSAARQVEFRFSGQREPAYTWSRALREDDELLFALLTD